MFGDYLLVEDEQITYITGRFSPASNANMRGKNALEQPSPTAVRVGQNVNLHVLQNVGYSTISYI